MTPAIVPPRRILAVMDDSADHVTLLSAAALADRHGAAIEAFVCIEPPHDINVLARLAGRDPSQLIDTLAERRRADVRELIAQHLPGRDVALHLARGKTFVEVIRHVLASDVDFVIKTAEPLTGVHRFLFASTDQHLLRKCPCPVWLQTETAPPTPRRVLAAVDVDAWDADEPETLHALNRRVIETACAIADQGAAEVVVLHAWEALGEGMIWAFSSTGDGRMAADAYINEVIEARRRALDRLVKEVLEDGTSKGVVLTPLLVRGAPERVIEEQGRELGADVVVMGTVARTGLSGVFIGNTAENIINSLECPVLAVKPDGFRSPLDMR